ncbi:MAG: YceI family protein [Flavobacterium nitrogenifigens]|uniref:YceI-like domain-containing protein n=1 Tax=Flavobacterium nitrogenifigens TaxID=1617283 RepID=A0A521EN58_9FLAO|nr:YceI family protein [Flavobacterium nitrogenifigens]KAF2326175.1 YceI family protein [Flavobacterium nitrogenifigens]MDQ8012256.1 YceI family protein [Flavobacterium nitrogenifigens]SMO84550.1 YceI-like domain-containing protein [Flavobacterium nitrogenifigens]
MKTTTLLFLFFTAFSVIAQDKFFTNTGTINFEASVPMFEEVKAVNRQVAILLEPKTSTFICTVIVKNFRFKLDLMQEHFNENYMLSNRYPKAVFKGKIEKFDLKDINEVEKQYQIKGKLNLRGKSKEIIVNALIKRVPEGIQVISDFPILVSDFNIHIPSSIASKIATTANTELTGIIRSDETMLTLK